MKFGDFKYERADIEVIKKSFKELLDNFKRANSVEDECSIIDKINEIRNEFISMSALAFIRKSLGVDKEFYSDELDYYDDAEPVLEGLVCDYYKVIHGSKYKEELENKYGKQLFNLANMKVKCVSDSIIEDLQREKKLITEYVDLVDNLSIGFNGEEVGIWDFDPYIDSEDRKLRKRAFETQTKLYRENEDKIQGIFDEFVKLRHQMALKMGYENFIEMGYARMNRVDYDKGMVEKFREEVRKYVVPLNEEITKRQGKRLGIEKVKYYDESVHFLDGNAKMIGDTQVIIQKTLNMYNELSPETAEFFKHMVDRNLFDIDDREGKEEGGFCDYIPKYRAPFIYSVYRGTIDDFNVFTHEAGHAFQNYLCKDFEIPEYCIGPEDVSEIHSMSMEFLTEPWVEDFFGKDGEKYKFSHMCNALSLLAYICVVDEFQHFIYEKPEATYQERNSFWRELEKVYLPHRDYEDNAFLEKGAYWLRQSHVFWGPFYYIDYGLAGVAAFNFWYKNRENREEAWKDYMRICRVGGSRSFKEVIDLANLKNPFEEGSLKEIVDSIEEWILGAEERLNKDESY